MTIALWKSYEQSFRFSAVMDFVVWHNEANLWNLWGCGDRLVPQTIAGCFPDSFSPNSSAIAVSNGAWC